MGQECSWRVKSPRRMEAISRSRRNSIYDSYDDCATKKQREGDDLRDQTVRRKYIEMEAPLPDRKVFRSIFRIFLS